MTNDIYQKLRRLSNDRDFRSELVALHYDLAAIERVYHTLVNCIKDQTRVADVDPHALIEDLGYGRDFEFEDLIDDVMHDAGLTLRFAAKESWTVETVHDLWLALVLRCMMPADQALLRPVSRSDDSSLLRAATSAQSHSESLLKSVNCYSTDRTTR